MIRQSTPVLGIGVLLALGSSVFGEQTISPKDREFFESRIRPVLVEHCYECHNSAQYAEADLAVDSRAGIRKGGSSGPAVVPGKPEQSRLLKVIRHEIDGQKMPDGGPKLDARVVADFEKWIRLGAADPRDKPPSAEELTKATSWEAMLQRRKKWWSFQPIRRPALPKVQNTEWSSHPVDRFVLARLESTGLEPAERADRRTLLRRVSFALTGLPPTPSAIAEFLADDQPGAYEREVDRLLGSKHFGERWARHWMDWIRYAESHGSEGDPAIDNAWMYRDYLIRALNADVPYDQLVREHIAGDLLAEPRINESLGINESLLGTAHWRMVFHGFAPTDALDEKVRFTDDQINAFSKAFLGLTVSCARCHNHKFDPISQADYYALFGILGSCRPGRVAIDIARKQLHNRDALAELKPQIRDTIADDWLATLPTLQKHLLADNELWKKANNPKFVLHPWFVMRREASKPDAFPEAWKRRVEAWQQDRNRRQQYDRREHSHRWKLGEPADYAKWFPTGNGPSPKPNVAGEFAVAVEGDNALMGIYPAGVYSHAISTKHAARLTSPNVHLDTEYDVYVRALGGGGSTFRYVVQNYPRSGTVYPVAGLNETWRWQRYSLKYWTGDDIHLELTAGKDAPLLVKNSPRSWFGVREAILVKKGSPAPAESHEHLDPLFETAQSPTSLEELAECYTTTISTAIHAWRNGKASDAQAMLLQACLEQGVLANRLASLPTASPLVTQYRKLETEVPVLTRVPGLEETVGKDQPLFVRGDHKKPGKAVPRRFLEAIDATPYKTDASGRLRLAEDVLRDDNPLSRRVIVNRLWHHLFGRGIVATPDNLGKLGALPTHPELLDYLATRFVDEGWSLKKAIRFLVTSKTWQLASQTSEKALASDPDNRLLSHANVRRLEAEAIRDSLLAVSGELSSNLFGPPSNGDSNRRSVYVQVRRNSLDPFLRVFDFPEPFSATGRRDVTNVPAQALTLMNDPRVQRYASAWTSQLLTEPDENARIRRMFLTAFGRPASADEIARVKVYLDNAEQSRSALAQKRDRLGQQIAALEATIRVRTEPVRKRLLAEAKDKAGTPEQTVPSPIARWEFKDSLKDVIGTAHGLAKGGAKIEKGALVVRGQGHVLTAPLKQTIKAKTLEAWVQLDTLNQRGGGVMSIQTPNGVVFDAIVFGEKDPRQWLAGSNFFRRTQSFGAPTENEATKRPVHVAIAYHEDGRIVGYRDGKPYGRAYKSSGPVEFKAGQTILGFGVRHLPAGGNRMLAGRIVRAQLYDRALSDEEITATSQALPYFVSEAKVLAALAPKDREQVESATKEIAKLRAEIESLGPMPAQLDERGKWTDLARALFTFKEFIYIK